MAAIDHVFVFCRAEAPEQRRLLEHGLRVGARRDHPGQGTRNVCFGFADSYLELLWLADDAAARHPIVKPLGLQERARWRECAASPFGLSVRADAPGAAPPFAHWDYRPPYLPPEVAIRMGCNSGVLGEPLLFQIERPFAPFAERHALSAARLARVTATVPDLAPMSLLRDVAVPGLVIADGDAPLLALELTGGDGHGELDLRPELPLVLRW